MNITPEVAERVKKAGVPLFTLAGATALGLGNDDANASPVEDQSMQDANQGYGEGGEVAGRLAGLLKQLTAEAPKAAATAPATPTVTPFIQKLRAQYLQNIANRNNIPVDSIQPPWETPPVAPITNQAKGGSIDHVGMALARMGHRPPITAAPVESFADGGAATEHEDDPSQDPDSSLVKISDFLNRYGGKHVQRIGTGIAKQFYGTDKNGHLVLGGRGYTDSQGGTPAGILDSFAAIPAGVIPLANALSGGKESGPELQSPQWSTDAAARLAALDKKVASATGVGEAQTLPEHIEDAAGMLATPFPAAKVVEEAPAVQRALELLTPLRPPTLARYGTDSALFGGTNAALQALTNKVAAKPSTPDNSGAGADPAFAAAALQATNDTGNDDTRDIHNTHRMIPMTDSSGHSYYGVDPATFGGGGKVGPLKEMLHEVILAASDPRISTPLHTLNELPLDEVHNQLANVLDHYGLPASKAPSFQVTSPPKLIDIGHDLPNEETGKPDSYGSFIVKLAGPGDLIDRLTAKVKQAGGDIDPARYDEMGFNSSAN
jgi:hypothetical protein